MLMRSQPVVRLDRPAPSGTWSRPAPLPVDVIRTAGETVFAMDLPGVDPDAIDIELTPDVLTVRAERRPSSIDAQDRLWVSERRLGMFARRLVLTDPVDVERVSADYDNGVLTIRVPVARRPHRHKVTVTTTASGGAPTDGGEE
jgi:HSP20 family protein